MLELRRGLEALGLQADDLSSSRLLAFLDLLARWNKHYNLTAVRDPQTMLSRHLLDCLAVLPSLDRHFLSCQQPHPPRLLDVGSGAGLPGVVLAIMRPDWSVSCVDAVAKKTAFVQQAAAELGLKNLASIHSRVEELRVPTFNLIVSRAFASLHDFTRLTAGHLARSGCWVAMKGSVPIEEAAALPPSVTVFHVEQLVVPGLDAQRCLVWLRNTELPPLGQAFSD
ncbi:MAG: 16S rRNA (guanine(527)-N(7))-methyltransferase RsmG [Rubrivivax sp.]